MHQKHLLLLALVALTLAGCSGDDDPTTPDTGTPGDPGTPTTFEEVIRGAGDYQDPATFHLEEVTDEGEDHRPDGSVWLCSTRQVSLQEAPAEFFLASSTADIYPGALLQGATLENDPPSRVRADRGAGTVVINLFTGESETNFVDIPTVSESRVKQAVNEIIADRELFPDQFSFALDVVESEEDLRVKLNMRVETFTTEVEGDLQFSTDREYNRYVVKLVQPFYEISFEPPNEYDEFFAPDVDPADLVDDMGPGNPPVYIRSVKYGRIVYILVESTSSLTQMDAALRVSYQAAVNNGTLDAELHYTNQLDNLKVRATVYGGSMDVSALTGNYDDLRDALNDEQSIALALPLSYHMEDLQSGQPIKVKLATEYTVRNCELVSAGLAQPLAIWDTDGLTLEARNLDGFAAFGGTVASGPAASVFPSVLATGLPDASGNGNDLGFGSVSTRPQVVADPDVAGDAIQFRTMDALAGAWPIPEAHRRTYATFSGTLLEDRDYTVFAVLRAPGSITHRYVLPGTTLETSLTNEPGYFMAGETLGQSQRNILFGFQGGSTFRLSHGTGGLTGTSPSAITGYQVYTARFSRTDGMALFVNGEKVSEDPAAVAEIIALSGGKLGAAHPSAQSGLGHSFVRMRRVEIYDGAIGDDTIADHASDLRNSLGI